MKRSLFIGVALFGLAGCAALNPTFDVSPQAVINTAAAFDAVEIVAANYLRLPLCGSVAVVCRDPAAAHRIAPVIHAARRDRDRLEAYLKVGSSAPIPIGALKIVENAINNLRAIFTQYNIQG